MITLRKVTQSPELRVLVTPSCQLRCIFCHNEGQLAVQNTWKKDALVALRQATYLKPETVKTVLLPLKEHLGIKVIHLTGGEPTLNPKLVEIAKVCHEHFDMVKMTTNGVFDPSVLEKLRGVLTSITFSVHATSWGKFKLIQGAHLVPDCAEKYFNQQMNNIEMAQHFGFRLSINSVVLDKDITVENIQFANHRGVIIRLMRDLNQTHVSEQIIQEIVRERQFRLVGTQLGSSDSSAYRENYVNNAGLCFELKRLQEMYLDGMCTACPIIDRCKEYFYGIRIEPDGRVRLCIHRDDAGVVMSIKDFLNSPLFQKLRLTYYPQGDRT